METMTGWGPYETPGIIKKLMIFTTAIAIAAALLNPLFVKVFSMWGPLEWFSLSYAGLSHYYIWQLVTYIFVQDGGSSDGISFFFLLALAFNMYILWVLGSMVQERVGNLLFMALYLGAGVCVGAITVLTGVFIGQQVHLAGPTAPLLALLVCWGMYYPDSLLHLFFLIPLQTKWVVAGVAAVAFLLGISDLDIVSLVYYLSSMAFGYIFSGLILGLPSPFAVLQGVDRFLEQGHQWLFGKGDAKSRFSKIIPLDEGAEMEEEAFIDAMLTKIAQHGENSLTAREQARMRAISRRRKKS